MSFQSNNVVDTGGVSLPFCDRQPDSGHGGLLFIKKSQVLSLVIPAKVGREARTPVYLPLPKENKKGVDSRSRFSLG